MDRRDGSTREYRHDPSGFIDRDSDHHDLVIRSHNRGKLVIEALRETKSVSQIAGENGLHPNPITNWKQAAIDTLPSVFDRQAGGTALGVAVESVLPGARTERHGAASEAAARRAVS